MQYSSFIGDHIPCRFKTLIEDSSLRQLQFSSEDRQFRNRAKGKNSTEESGSKGNGKKRKGSEEDGAGKQLSLKDIFLLISKGGNFTRAFRGWKICPITHNKPVLYGLPDDPKARSRRSNSLYLSSYSVDFPQFISRSARSMNLQCGKESRSAKSCLAKSSAGSLLLTPSQIISRSATRIRSCHASATTNVSVGTGTSTGARPIAGTATGATSRQRFIVSQVVRPASSCLVAASNNQRRNDSLRPVTSSSEQSSAVDDPIDVEFDFDDNSYVSCYREGYTFRKLREKQSRSSSTKSTPSATPTPPHPQHQAQAQTNSCRSWVRSISDAATTNVSKSLTIVKQSTVSARCREVDTCCRAGNIQKPPKTAPGSNDRVEHADDKNSIPWQINQRFHDICDPRLTVNNPSPTEVAVPCRIPQMIHKSHKSSPSIPSNTNGRFGAKGSEEPYPFQLNISAARCPVKSTTKKANKSLFDFI